MIIKKTAIPDVLVLSPARYYDERGFFSESWNRKVLSAKGLDVEFVQDNHSLSLKKGTVRGLHYQALPHAQSKLVRCCRGRLYDVVVDIREGSPTYGKWIGEELSFENGRQLFVPKGFLHGFMTLEDNTEILYKCSDYYNSECDGAVHWESCNIEWPFKIDSNLLSKKDKEAPIFSEFKSHFKYKKI